MSDTEPTPAFRLPDVNRVPLSAPVSWLLGGVRDFAKAPAVFMAYGIVLAAISAAIAWGLLFSGQFAWVFVLAGGFLLVAPMLAMGLYEAGRRIEAGEAVTLGSTFFVRGALRADLAYLGLALFLIYLLWTRIAQIVYALATRRIHDSPMDFLAFMFTEPSGQMMALTGTAIGAVIAFLAFALVVVSAPMLLDTRRDVFIATITSFRATTANFAPLALWALIIAVVTALGIATGFFGLIFVFPVLGLASWRAYRALVAAEA